MRNVIVFKSREFHVPEAGIPHEFHISRFCQFVGKLASLALSRNCTKIQEKDS